MSYWFWYRPSSNKNLCYGKFPLCWQSLEFVRGHASGSTLEVHTAQRGRKRNLKRWCSGLLFKLEWFWELLLVEEATPHVYFLSGMIQEEQNQPLGEEYSKTNEIAWRCLGSFRKICSKLAKAIYSKSSIQHAWRFQASELFLPKNRINFYFIFCRCSSCFHLSSLCWGKSPSTSSPSFPCDISHWAP